MNRAFFILLLAGVTCLCVTATPVRADARLSPDRIDALDERGYFTPGFKAAVHDLVDAKDELAQVTADKDKLTAALPALEKKAAQAEAEAVALRQELAKYDHPEEIDFDALEARMKDPSAKLGEQIALAQAYLWTYPTSAHLSEVQQDLEQAQKTLADQAETEKQSEASRAAARAALVQRAQAHDLSLAEWRSFLIDMSQDDLVKVIGRPTTQTDDGYWIYTGDWATNPATHQKSGLQLGFNGTRVLTVDAKPSTP
jgi:hypothetical protein